MASFVPVSVGDYLKKFGDLLNKKYKSIKSNDLVVKATDGEGMSIETQIVSAYPKADQSPQGTVKITYKDKPTASKLEFYTDSQVKITGKAETTYFKGWKFTGSGAMIPPYLIIPKKHLSNVAFSAEYTQNKFTGKGSVVYKKAFANASPPVKAMDAVDLAGAFSFGNNGVSIGGKVGGTYADKKFAVTGWGAGANVKKGDIVFGIFSNKFEDVTTGVHYKYSKKTAVGIQTTMKKAFPKKPEEKKAFSSKSLMDIGAGVDYKFNKDTTLQGKVDIGLAMVNPVDTSAKATLEQTVSVGGVMEYALTDFNSKLQLTTICKASGADLGLKLTYGDK
uniref:Uncharacterized protein n=1 Tax=Lotharella globosa TaxID=91324 RepID=A0A7S3Z803_9EUKA